MTLESQYQKYLSNLQQEMNITKLIIEPLTYEDWLDVHSHLIKNNIQKLVKKGSHNTFTNNKGITYFFINVSKHAYDFSNIFSGMLFSKRKDTGYERENFMYLPKIFYVDKQIIGKANDLTEKQYKDIVDSMPIEIMPSPYNDMGGGLDYGYVDYLNIGEHVGYAGWGGDSGVFMEAKDSLEALLQSMNMQLETTLIMQKNG